MTTMDDEIFKRAFNQKRVLRMNLEMDDATREKAVVIEIMPEPVVQCYGIGLSLNELRKDPTGAKYKVQVSEGRI